MLQASRPLYVSLLYVDVQRDIMTLGSFMAEVCVHCACVYLCVVCVDNRPVIGMPFLRGSMQS